MSRTNSLRWGRFILVCLLSFLGGYLLFRQPASVASQAPAKNLLLAKQPTPELAADEVVQIQIGSLQDFRTDESALAQCFAFASPENREVTGPLDHFAEIVQSPDYIPLVSSETSLVGKPVVRGELAAVLVTVVDRDRHTSLYRFFLSRQAEGKLKGCWMTDAVVLIPVETPPAAPPIPDEV